VSTEVQKDADAASRLLERHQEALFLWLRWNDAHQRATSVLYDAGEDSARIEQILDQLDQLRLKAVQISQELLDSAE
jgi:hypothetical protein